MNKDIYNPNNINCFHTKNNFFKNSFYDISTYFENNKKICNNNIIYKKIEDISNFIICDSDSSLDSNSTSHSNSKSHSTSDLNSDSNSDYIINFFYPKLNGIYKIFYDGFLYYEGSLIYGIFNGKGKLYHSNNKLKYFGSWKNGKKHGIGVEFDEFASIINNGIWHNNKLVDYNKKENIINI